MYPYRTLAYIWLEWKNVSLWWKRNQSLSIINTYVLHFTTLHAIFLAFRKYMKVKKWNWKRKEKNMCYKNSNAKKVKCQTVVGLWCLFERDLKRLANCEVNAPETRAASLPGLLEQAWLCSTEHNETFFFRN